MNTSVYIDHITNQKLNLMIVKKNFSIGLNIFFSITFIYISGKPPFHAHFDIVPPAFISFFYC